MPHSPFSESSLHMFRVSDRMWDTLDVTKLDANEINRRLVVLATVRYYHRFVEKNRALIERYEAELRAQLPEVEPYPPIHSDWQP
jgi:hypothetical protein